MINHLRYLDIGKYSSVLLVLARIMMGFLYISSGIPKLLAFSSTVDKMSDLGLMLPSITAVAVVVIEVIGAIMIITGFFTRVTSLILCLYTIAASIIGHAFWSMPDALAHDNMIHFYKNICISGGFLTLAILGPGSISFDKR
ncbi:TPA: DoxX family protein [Klebsiella pneumoniae]|uniref:DoxX family protein n=1 Tax=Enterobacteriaceae TaxID=543 RepID=UPI001D0D0F4C|nr:MULTISPECIES: DoxX family protein [Enterobacteriaceae]MCH9347642.1 DoxX family protein [Klebsiella pneumoniae]MCH9363502.1 DoxX family protein [Klebsiella pneumoniae]MCH9437799.1 DoxX family protein [Klebsiella pneumoniae]MCH9464166.1 DoxX family protein [Klebsiella pneumoniae]MCH9469836.1 DoxX family protein [Klebsiella pneumoniae]